MWYFSACWETTDQIIVSYTEITLNIKEKTTGQVKNEVDHNSCLVDSNCSCPVYCPYIGCQFQHLIQSLVYEVFLFWIVVMLVASCSWCSWRATSIAAKKSKKWGIKPWPNELASSHNLLLLRNPWSGQRNRQVSWLASTSKSQKPVSRKTYFAFHWLIVG